MQYRKITFIAAIGLIIYLFCTNNTQQDVGNLYNLPLGSDQDQTNSDNSFIWPEGKKMGLTLTFDDARLTQVDKGIPLLDKYNVKGTFYISPKILVGHEMNNQGGQTSLLSTLEAICEYAMDPANEIWIDNTHNIASYILQKRNEMALQPEEHVSSSELF